MLLQEYSWLIPLLPLIAGLLIIFFFRNNRYLSSSVSIFAIISSLVYSILLFFQKHGMPYENNTSWLNIGDFTLSWGILLDPLTITMLLVVTTVSLLVQIYSHGYMSHDDGYSKFFAYLSLFSASMLALVLSTNLFQLYIFWELVGLCSYLLIGFWHTRVSAGNAALKAFVINRIGDFGLLIGILMLGFYSIYSGGYNPAEMTFLGFTHLTELTHSIEPSILMVIALLLFIGAMAKSAQFPLHTWLPDAMEGPTPISALIHAATMVAAGVYLVARILPPIYGNLPAEVLSLTSGIIATIGGFTALYAAYIALTQYDIKKALAYSTCSQLGLMIMAAGCGAWIYAIFHLITHAYFKSLLFLGSGSVIHANQDEQDMRKFGGLHKSMPITSWTFLLGTMAISAIPLFSGFWSKELLLNTAWQYSGILFVVSVIASMMTCFYMFRIYFLTFCGQFRGETATHKQLHESPKSMAIPLIILAIPTIFLGYIGTELSIFGGNHFAHYLGATGHHAYSIGQFIGHLFASWHMAVPVIGTFVFIGLAYLIYMQNKFSTIVNFLQNSWLFQISSNKFYLDEFYGVIIEYAFNPIIKSIQYIVNDLIINNIIKLVDLWCVLKANSWARLFQHGQVQGYIGSVIVFVLIIGGLTFIKPLQATESLDNFKEQYTVKLTALQKQQQQAKANN